MLGERTINEILRWFKNKKMFSGDGYPDNLGPCVLVIRDPDAFSDGIVTEILPGELLVHDDNPRRVGAIGRPESAAGDNRHAERLEEVRIDSIAEYRQVSLPGGKLEAFGLHAPLVNVCRQWEAEGKGCRFDPWYVEGAFSQCFVDLVRLIKCVAG